jgi:uncharacterized membrane protein YeaQ/YmgE (transglycosylase-associated protein family)
MDALRRKARDGRTEIFFPTSLPQIYWKNLLDLTVCKIASSNVDGGNGGICLMNAVIGQVASIPTPSLKHCRLTGASVYSRLAGGSGGNFRLQAAARRTGMGFLAWIVVGLIAGWLAGQVMKGGGYGILVDIILGILGGILGGWVFGLLGIWPGGGMIGSIIVAFVGAVILVGITRLLKTA